jgi:hypothetical protein
MFKTNPSIIMITAEIFLNNRQKEKEKKTTQR